MGDLVPKVNHPMASKIDAFDVNGFVDDQSKKIMAALTAQREVYLYNFMAENDLTVHEFIRDYYVEEEPVTWVKDDSFGDLDNAHYTVTQQFRIRLKSSDPEQE